MITFEDLQNEWAKDCSIKPDRLDEESLNTPNIHGKYLKYLSDIRLIKLKKEQEFKILWKNKHLYYSGKADPEVYKEKPFQMMVLKQDLPMYIDSDPEIQALQTKIKYYEEMMIFLEKVIVMINNRGYQIKNAIDWQRFTQGLN